MSQNNCLNDPISPLSPPSSLFTTPQLQNQTSFVRVSHTSPSDDGGSGTTATDRITNTQEGSNINPIKTTNSNTFADVQNNLLQKFGWQRNTQKREL